jgi:adenylate kinase family enzyme
MNKAIVIGCPGSGKSVFSRALHEITSLPLYHLDMIYWREDKTVISREELIEKIKEIGENDKWIIDGNYGATMELRMSLCDTIFFLDYPSNVCLEGIIARRGAHRADMPWADPDEPDGEFVDFVKNYNSQNRPHVLKRIEKYSDKDIHIFKSREEADGFLDTLRESNGSIKV